MVQVRGRNQHPKRGELRIYLGAAPGVGKTYAMLGEAHRRLERGTEKASLLGDVLGDCAAPATRGEVPVKGRHLGPFRETLGAGFAGYEIRGQRRSVTAAR